MLHLGTVKDLLNADAVRQDSSQDPILTESGRRFLRNLAEVMKRLGHGQADSSILNEMTK
jgi:hypothetical protein